MLSRLRERMQPFERALAAPFVWFRIPPSVITVLSVFPALAAAYFAADREWLVAFGFGAAAGFLDVIDGTVARVTKRTTPFGGYLDSVLDRVVDLSFLFGVGLGLNTPTTWWVVGACAVGAVGTSYAKARAYEEIRTPAAFWRGGFERGERTVLIGLGGLTQGLDGRYVMIPSYGGYPVLLWFLMVYAAGSILTMNHRIQKVRRQLENATP